MVEARGIISRILRSPLRARSCIKIIDKKVEKHKCRKSLKELLMHFCLRGKNEEPPVT
jgi:hypothetical protein